MENNKFENSISILERGAAIGQAFTPDSQRLLVEILRGFNNRITELEENKDNKSGK